MDCCYVTPLDRAPRSADHSDEGIEPGSLPGRPRNHAHRQGVVGRQGQNQHPGLTGTNQRAAAQRVMLPVGVGVIVDANDQVDRLSRRVVDGYCKRRHSRPIGRVLGRPNYQLRPIGQLKIDPRGDAAGVGASPGDLRDAGACNRDARGIGWVAEADDRRYLRFRPPGLRRHPQRDDEKEQQQSTAHRFYLVIPCWL